MKNLLIVVDYQNDFVSGSLGFENAKKLDKEISKKIDFYRDNNYEIVFTFDTHDKDYLSTQEGLLLPIEHCIYGTEGWKLYGEVAKKQQPDDKVFYKRTFGSIDLLDYLRDKHYDNIELVGLVSNICVISNAIIAKTAQPEASIIIDARCTASADNDINNKTLDILEGLQMKVLR